MEKSDLGKRVEAIVQKTFGENTISPFYFQGADWKNEKEIEISIPFTTFGTLEPNNFLSSIVLLSYINKINTIMYIFKDYPTEEVMVNLQFIDAPMCPALKTIEEEYEN